jgi:ATP-binding cassette subfamily B protein
MKFLSQLYREKKSLVKQYSPKDCGPAALLTILRFYGGQASLPFMRELCQTSPTGTTMFDMVKAAEHIGFKASGVIGQIDDMAKIRLPCIAHLILPDGLQHYVVIFAVYSKSIQIGDPADGLKKISIEKFNLLWASRALILFEPDGTLYVNRVPSWLSWLITFLSKERSWIYQTLFLGIIYAAIGLFTAVFIQQLIDRYLPNNDIDRIILTAILLAVLFFIRAGAGYLRYRFLVEVHKRMGIHLNLRYVAHVFRLPQRFFDKCKNGDITARLHDGIRIQNAVLQVVGSTFIDGMLILSSLFYMYFLSEQLTFYTIIVLPVYALVIVFPLHKIRRKQKNVMHSFADLESTFIESLNSIADIIAFHTMNSFAELNQQKCRIFQQNIAGLGELQGRLNFFADLTGATATLFILCAGALLVVENNIQLGQMIAAYALLANIIPATGRLVDLSFVWQGAAIASRRLLDILLQEQNYSEKGVRFQMKSALTIKNASFGWSRINMFLKDISFCIPKGRMTVLFGPSGSGKSTLAHIILRKYQLASGSIRVDSEEAECIQLRNYRNRIAMVPQYVSVFNGTLLENILIGRNSVSAEQFNQFINDFNLHLFFNRFQHGIHTRLGEEGQHLSGGEKQVLGLSRALLFYPDLLIIDEGLNAMDVHLYKLSIDIIKKYKQRCAILISTHDRETLMQADYVYVLKNGAIVNKGKPSEIEDRLFLGM